MGRTYSEHDLEQALRRTVPGGPPRPDFANWREKHPEEACLLEHGFADASRSRKTKSYPPWRCIMESRVTRYSAAAVITLAALLVLTSPLGTSKNGGVALAAVQAKMAQVDTMILRGETTFTSVSDPNTTIKYSNVKYLSRQNGFVEEGYLKDSLMYRVILNRPEKQGLLLFPAWKKGLRFPCTDEQLKVVEKLTPTGVVDLLLQSEYKRLGTATIDGVEVEGFEVQDLKPLENIVPRFLMDLQEGKATIWVSTKELLPVRMEADMLLGKTFTTLFMDVSCHEVAVLEKYNVELDPGLFGTEMPEGYTEFTFTDFLPVRLSLAGLGMIPAGAVARKRLRRKALRVKIG
jgi:outer membrane lipoprotein-sorting protein